MKSVTPIALLLATALIWTGCTPSKDGNEGALPSLPGAEETEKISTQEQILESVGLKFVIVAETEGESSITYVTWDEEARQAWLDSHAAEDVKLQVAELKQFLALTESEIDNEDADELLYSKRNLVQLTLDELE